MELPEYRERHSPPTLNLSMFLGQAMSAAVDLMLADSDYYTYFLLAMMQNRGVDVVFEQHGTRKTDFQRGQSIGTRDHVV